MSEIIAQNEIFKVIISKAALGYSVSIYKFGVLEKKYKAHRTKGRKTSGCFVFNIFNSLRYAACTVYTVEGTLVITPVNGMEIYLTLEQN